MEKFRNAMKYDRLFAEYLSAGTKSELSFEDKNRLLENIEKEFSINMSTNDKREFLCYERGKEILSKYIPMPNEVNMPSNIAIIGTGNVGASCAYALMLREVTDKIILIDKDKPRVNAEILDIEHGIPYMGNVDLDFGDYSSISDCGLIIITAGVSRKPSQSRLDLIKTNISIAKDIADNIKKNHNGCPIMVVSNPVDILTYYIDKWIGLEPGRVFGTGCMLDTSRFIRAVANHLQISPNNVRGFVLGEHGDEQYPLWNKLYAFGQDINDYCQNKGIPWTEIVRAHIAEDVRKMGASIIAGKGKTNFGIATCVLCLAEAIIENQPIVASVSTVFKGECGISDVALSVPSIVGRYGAAKLSIHPLKQTIDNIEHAAKSLKEVIQSV